ncbi:MAG: polyprenyl synthetase family protein [Polyangiaceae bacterium]|nr:polyprenyl synthetase family protein [Polyangiaceae bacterium]
MSKERKLVDPTETPTPCPDGATSQRIPATADPEDAFQELLSMVRRDVDARLAGYLDARVAETARHGADVEAMTKAIRELTLRGGKRLRAALVLLGYLATDDEVSWGPALDAGVAFELLQTYLLVHDDWMDGDERRRGGPSVHAMLQVHHQSTTLGNAAAILAGDLAAALSLDVLSRLDSPPDRLVRAMGLFAEIQQDVICGQQLDISRTAQNVEVFYPLKTGSYTVRGPLLLGAILADAPPGVMRTLEQYSKPLGIAFQMQDDLLGTFGDPEKIGKPVGEDLRRGTHTVIAQYAINMLNETERQAFDAVFGNTQATDEQMALAITVLSESGVRESVLERIHALIHDAISALVGQPIAPPARAMLLGFCSILASRID